ncbi:MAG: hypothetical protein KF819_07045 [Labilithrix sp.]|nr:hypothetical protein [Labilithrix sp.]
MSDDGASGALGMLCGLDVPATARLATSDEAVPAGVFGALLEAELSTAEGTSHGDEDAEQHVATDPTISSDVLASMWAATAIAPAPVELTTRTIVTPTTNASADAEAKPNPSASPSASSSTSPSASPSADLNANPSGEARVEAGPPPDAPTGTEARSVTPTANASALPRANASANANASASASDGETAAPRVASDVARPREENLTRTFAGVAPAASAAITMTPETPRAPVGATAPRASAVEDPPRGEVAPATATPRATPSATPGATPRATAPAIAARPDAIPLARTSTIIAPDAPSGVGRRREASAQPAAAQLAQALDASLVEANEAGEAPEAPEGAPVGITAPNDGRPTLSVRAPTAAPPREAASRLSNEVRERVRDTASAAADHHALRRGVHAEVDMGGAGRVGVRAENEASGAQIHVRLEADRAETARAIADHASELAFELRSDARAARVSVTGPGTSTSVASDSAGRQGGGAGSSAHDRDEPRGDESAPAPRARAATRARFVL